MENENQENQNNYQETVIAALNKYRRDENGLLNGVEYVFNEDGSINWREMVPKEFLFPNKDLFKRRGKEAPSSIEGLKDYELCIKLGGIRHLAKLRGIGSCDFHHPRLDNNYVVSHCTIQWMPNYETNGNYTVFADSANATSDNCRDFGLKFLETIANNRAFIRAVRNYLNVNIVGEDELDKTETSTAIDAEPDEQSNNLSPVNIFNTKMKNRGFSKIKNVREFLRFLKSEKEMDISEEDINKACSASDIPKKDVIRLLGKLDDLFDAFEKSQAPEN